jgi:hypothetical protein
MMAKRRSRSSGGSSGGAALFGVLLIVGLIVKFFWWILAAVAAVGLFFAVRALVRHLEERRDAAARNAEEIAYRADRQNRMAQRGDARGVYGVAGADLMRDISPEPPAMPSRALGDDVVIAALANTAAEMSRLLDDKSPGWRWAAFASVLTQRRAAVRPRVRDVRLGFATPTGGYVRSGAEVAQFVTASMDELLKLVGQTEAFMLTPAFMEVFGQHGDESTADAEGIVQVANRLMDYHERFLKLAERCRDFDTPARYSGLMQDCGQLMNIPLDGYDTFVDDFTEFIARMPDMMRYGRGTVEADPISLHMSVDDALTTRISRQIRMAAK